jgi:hypothetical protein
MKEPRDSDSAEPIEGNCSTCGQPIRVGPTGSVRIGARPSVAARKCLATHVGGIGTREKIAKEVSIGSKQPKRECPKKGRFIANEDIAKALTGVKINPEFAFQIAIFSMSTRCQ